MPRGPGAAGPPVRRRTPARRRRPRRLAFAPRLHPQLVLAALGDRAHRGRGCCSSCAIGAIASARARRPPPPMTGRRPAAPTPPRDRARDPDPEPLLVHGRDARRIRARRVPTSLATASTAARPRSTSASRRGTTPIAARARRATGFAPTDAARDPRCRSEAPPRAAARPGARTSARPPRDDAAPAAPRRAQGSALRRGEPAFAASTDSDATPKDAMLRTRCETASAISSRRSVQQRDARETHAEVVVRR